MMDFLKMHGIKVIENEHIPGDMVIVTNGKITTIKLVDALNAVAAERARCAAIVKRHLAPMTHDRAAILCDIEEGGSDDQAHDGE